MKNDLDLIRKKIRTTNKMPEGNPKEYNLKQDILRHWKLELYKLQNCIKLDMEFLKNMRV